jgi:hypothetical protein
MRKTGISFGIISVSSRLDGSSSAASLESTGFIKYCFTALRAASEI